MNEKSITTLVVPNCEMGDHSTNCIDCIHFCGIKRNELRDSYVVECGYKPAKR